MSAIFDLRLFLVLVGHEDHVEGAGSANERARRQTRFPNFGAS